MKVFVDMDGVITDFMAHAQDFFGIKDGAIEFEKGDWNTVIRMCVHLRITENQFWRELKADWWSNMPMMEDAALILHSLERKFGAKNLCILSSPSDAESAKGKMEWIKIYMPDWYHGKRYLLGKGKHFVAHERALLVDDADKNVDAFRAHGGKAILYPRTWNSNHNITGEDALSYLDSELSGII